MFGNINTSTYSDFYNAGSLAQQRQICKVYFCSNLGRFIKISDKNDKTSINEKTLDEAPQAYKSLDDIIDVIDDTAEILEVMKPVYNFKASE